VKEANAAFAKRGRRGKNGPIRHQEAEGTQRSVLMIGRGQAKNIGQKPPEKRGEAKVGEKAEGTIGGKVYEPMKKRRGEKRFGGAGVRMAMVYWLRFLAAGVASG
jgi:hypothetical protein